MALPQGWTPDLQSVAAKLGPTWHQRRSSTPGQGGRRPVPPLERTEFRSGRGLVKASVAFGRAPDGTWRWGAHKGWHVAGVVAGAIGLSHGFMLLMGLLKARATAEAGLVSWLTVTAILLMVFSAGLVALAMSARSRYVDRLAHWLGLPQ